MNKKIEKAIKEGILSVTPNGYQLHKTWNDAVCLDGILTLPPNTALDMTEIGIWKVTPDRIKLTEEDIVPDEFGDGENPHHLTIFVDGSKRDQLKAQILDDYEKLPQIEDSLLGCKQLIQTLEQENKQLKDHIKILQTQTTEMLELEPKPVH